MAPYLYGVAFWRRYVAIANRSPRRSSPVKTHNIHLHWWHINCIMEKKRYRIMKLTSKIISRHSIKPPPTPIHNKSQLEKTAKHDVRTKVVKFHCPSVIWAIMLSSMNQSFLSKSCYIHSSQAYRWASLREPDTGQCVEKQDEVEEELHLSGLKRRSEILLLFIHFQDKNEYKMTSTSYTFYIVI